MKQRKKSLRIWSALLLFLALLIPQMAFAYTTTGSADNPSLTIHKFEQEPDERSGGEANGDAGQEAEGEPVEGVEFTLKQTHSYNPENDTWTEKSGAEIKGTTGADGTVTFTKANSLELGRYKVKETNGPDHIILNPDTFYVDIPMTNKEGNALNYNVHIYPKNETIRSDVKLKKVNEKGEPLAGVTFKLYNADDTEALDNKGNPIPARTTEDDGLIHVTGLAAGSYYFKETGVPYGYALNETKIGFTVQKPNKHSQDIEVVWNNVARFAENGTVTNYAIPTVDKDANDEKELDFDRDKEFNYNITIIAPENIDQYKALIVTDELDSRLEFMGKWSVEGASKDAFTFSQEGQTLKWTAVPSKLTGGKIKITFNAKIKPDAIAETGIENTAKLDFDNNFGWSTIDGPAKPEEPETPPVVTPTQGNLNVLKIDAADGKKLSGAEFKLTSDKDGKNIIDTSAMGDVVQWNDKTYNGLLEKLTTRADGTFDITGLTPGTYYLHETKAPTYTDGEGKLKSYRLLTKAIEIKIVDDETAKAEVKNSKSAWVLPTTGGLGTTLFTGVGLMLMMSASVLFMRRRQTETKED
ncbi:SpaA isopeptide-forming pilin-related protein [Bhargavaea massiliensis]|uniref:SpaA isopeptide-forming pilin-related protein n=1 Tax=Bhargavaea massiliensis TaxID=2697500 RepID=UPI001BCF2851|nr:SpaA isopeptide-forming pilin-related protein [Bhargavaea massiliensis]